ncbi:DNA-3-methyladenine glycosylase I [Halospina denitrificans]|uniref:DNA-3-methyladenine glycosylase I n=1 Tax=Halospina denitrificans TaxID=332522 RepID=A0A4R7K2A8_9GAMM|nr:DNA-3-methyladenine glycosylase I [Halospina denitrificans]TDT44167.1 DNA-3-methyladenine glycosylase I [Halospina denitrificans]
MGTDGRCPWCGNQPDYIEYHDNVWGRPVTARDELFEKLCLDGQQAGLSWLTILRKQAGYRAVFADFIPETLAEYTQADIERCLQDRRIVRNRRKAESIVGNARALLAMEADEENFTRFLWSFVGGAPIINEWNRMDEIPTETPESRAMSRALKKRGFRFVGPTICYAFMQAVGMVNDHLVTCPVRAETLALSRRLQPS